MIGELVGEKVVVKGKDADKLASRFYGKKEGKVLYLSLIEAAYLIENKKLDVGMRFEDFIEKSSKLVDRFLTKYYVYRDMKKRGYLLKTALKYGADFRVYEKGAIPGKEHSKWILFAVNENESFIWQKFAAMVRVAHSVKKYLMIGIVDDEGDVTYYEISWIKP